MSKPKEALYDRFIRKGKENLVVVAIAIVLLVAGALYPAFKDMREAAQDSSLDSPAAPRESILRLRPTSLDPASLSPANERIVFPGTDVPMLTKNGQGVVFFSYEGMDHPDPVETDRVILVAEFSVRVLDPEIGQTVALSTAMDDYIRVERIFDRSRIDARPGILRVAEGDIVTILSEQHRFRVERVWHRESMGRPISDPETTVVLTAIR